MAKLLLIEDEKILRENTRELLEAYGYECITAEHGKEGLKMAIKEVPDLVICDIMLPYLNGYEIKAELNKREDHALIPFIFLSAKIEREDLRQGMDLGASDYITKPFKIAELVNSIQIRLNQVKNLKTDVDTKIINSISDFIHITKHECNTPLHGIITLSELLANDPVVAGSDFLGKAIQSINMSGKRLLKILNNLIDLVRLRHYTEPIAARNKEINITDLLKNIIDECKQEFPNFKTININLDDISSNLWLLEDIQIVFFELVNNAFKFSKPDTPIEISLQNSFKNGVPVIQFSVTNTLAEPITFKEKDIGPFKQNNRADLEQQGSGLGLYISLLVTEKYMGNLTINSSIPEIFSIQVSIPSNIR